MIKKNKLLGFIELNFVNFFIMLIFRIFGYKIYYLTITNSFQNYQFIKFLENLNFFWLSYQEYEEKGENLKKKNDFKKISYKISKEITQKIWSKDVKKIFKKFIFLDLCIYERLQKEIKPLHELVCQLKNISKNDKYFIWSNTFEFTDYYLKKDLKIHNLCPSIFIHISFFIKYLTSILNFYFKKFPKFFEIRGVSQNHKKLSYKKYKYVFLPKGIVEGGSPKDYFLSNKKNHIFDNKNLLIAELEKKEIEGKHKNYLDKKKLDYCLWRNINFSSNKIKLKKIIEIYIKLFTYSKNIYITNLILKILILNERNLSNFRKLSKLKCLILGHEELTPLNIQVAALISGIKVISYQSRFQNSLPFHPFLFNYYFTSGRKLGDLVKINNLKLKQSKSISIGNYKKEQLELNKKKFFKEKTKIKKKYRYICSVWDYPSQLNWYFNGRESIGNYKRNKILIAETLLLAKSFPKVLFLIKSKNLNWTKLNYFNEIKSKIKKIKNIVISNMPYIKAVNISDLAYGNQTSAMDQLIYLNKPIVMRNYYKNFNDEIYSKKMISYNYNDSYKKISYILKSLSVAKKKQTKTKNFLFDIKTKKMSSEILKIINV